MEHDIKTLSRLDSEQLLTERAEDFLLCYLEDVDNGLCEYDEDEVNELLDRINEGKRRTL